MQCNVANAKRTAAALALLPALALAAAQASEPHLHVPSPDWRDQVIYFAMIDRFDDGDPSNNDQGAGEYDPADNARYSGGDLRGLARRVDYIHGLGASALWITPPVANQWWSGRYGGYHGYWAEHFMKVDAHYGTLADYRALSQALHAAGMYLVQDVVVNHTGDFFHYRGGWDPRDPARHYAPNTGSVPMRAPSQWPFSLNDARDPAQRGADIYHWTPAIADYTDPVQQTTWALAGLDDLNTENPLVRRALRESYSWWIREVGVDAFRVDTAFHVPAGYFADFLHAEDARHPGVLAVARATGRDRFHVFGEGFGIDAPYADTQARRIERYMHGEDGTPVLPAMINFPLYGSLGDVFARGRPPAVLGHRIGSMMRLHRNVHAMPSFVDNHDVDRFLAGGSQAGLKQALLAILTLPGIPTLYYGTEQGYTVQRAAMFAGGYGSGGRDRFDTAAPLYRWLQRAIALRRGHRLFSRGVPTVLDANAAAAGALAYRVDHDDARALVVFNSADGATLLDNLGTGWAPGTQLQPLFAIDGEAPALQVGSDGRISVPLPARAGLVWRAGPAAAVTEAAPARITLETTAPGTVPGDFRVEGRAEGVQQLQLVVDGRLDAARAIVPDADGRWQANVDTAGMVDPALAHRVVAWSDAPRAVSPALGFRVRPHWRLHAEADDPAGDDHGPDGRYRYPTDASWSGRHPLDLRGARAETAGGSLRLTVRMADLLAAWHPPNGFDHLAVTVFIELPGREDGATVMPQQHATLPAGMRWHYRLRAHGWSNALYSAHGADADSEGTPVTPAATLAVDRDARTVTFTLPATALGRPQTLAGARIHITTWDYDGGYRDIAPEPKPHTFGGANANAPLVMDSITVTLP